MKKMTILLADDDLDDTEMFCEALAEINENILCHCAANGDNALKVLEELEVKPELIFLDLNMPVMDGWECLRILKNDKTYQDIPVIMISTSSHKNDTITASNLGAICYFVKPNNFNDLKHVLDTITSNLGSGLKKAILNLEATTGHIFT